MIDIDFLKELNKKHGDDPKFQQILRDYLKGIHKKKNMKGVIYG